jgi:hypothetical protein
MSLLRASWPLLLASFVLASTANSQVTTVAPFTGAEHEEFETLLNYPWPQCLPGRAFSNHGDVCTPAGPYCVDTFGWLLYCAIYPHNGSNGLFGSAQGPVEVTFDAPAQRFGGYFGTNGFRPDGVANLYDSAGQLLASLPVTAPACDWAWNGWDAGPGAKIQRVELIGNDPYNGGGLLQMDDFEYDPAIPPGVDLCQPGIAGVLACPCANPSSGAPRGCNNSAGTGGARLQSSGVASLASDSLVFTTNGERPTSLSIVLQGDNAIASGQVYGQGVRCVGGLLKRLYVKSASGGSIVAPGPGDPSVSARSAAHGDPIPSGDDRWYLVYYRDPVVIGGCASTSTFNTTQTQRVGWNP